MCPRLACGWAVSSLWERIPHEVPVALLHMSRAIPDVPELPREAPGFPTGSDSCDFQRWCRCTQDPSLRGHEKTGTIGHVCAHACVWMRTLMGMSTCAYTGILGKGLGFATEIVFLPSPSLPPGLIMTLPSLNGREEERNNHVENL